MANASNTTAPTRFIETKLEKYAYRRFGKGNGLPLLCLQHFTGTLDNWDPAVTDPLAVGREVILFESAGLGRSTGRVPENMAGMAAHALAFVDALDLKRLDILGYSLGGMVAQQVALERPSLVHRMLLVATAPEGGEDIMHMEKPELRKITEDPNMPGLEKLVETSFLRQANRVKRPERPSRLGSQKESRMASLWPAKMSQSLRSRHFEPGNNTVAYVSPGSARSRSRAWSSTESSTI